MGSPAEAYVLLGLRLGRHVDGLVDAYYGPEELSRQVEAEPLAEPAALVDEADVLLAALDDGWLRDQACGLRTYAGVLAGEELTYTDEVERCYGVRPQRVSTEVYSAAHERLEELLPGRGRLAQRYDDWRDRTTAPPERVVPALRDVVDVLRERTSELVELPPAEEAVVEEVSDEPWWAFNYYLGEFRSRVVVNLDAPTTADDVVELAAHEVYPGHHTEHACKERRLLREQGLLEEAIQLVPVPAALVSEGIAEAGPSLVLDPETIERLGSVLARHGLEQDLAHARAVREARRPLRRLGLDAALMVHEDGASVEDAEAYVERWALVPAVQAARTVRFVLDPTWRAYAITYSSGGELCRAWVDGDPARLARLLTEYVRVRDLQAAVSSRA